MESYCNMNSSNNIYIQPAGTLLADTPQKPNHTEKEFLHMKSLFEQLGGTYHEENGYLIPDLPQDRQNPNRPPQMMQNNRGRNMNVECACKTIPKPNCHQDKRKSRPYKIYIAWGLLNLKITYTYSLLVHCLQGT